MGSRNPEASLVGILGIGSKAWDRLFSGPRPAMLHPFIELRGPHTAPSTPATCSSTLKADVTGLCYEVATKVTDALGGNATIVDEAHGFRYFDCATHRVCRRPRNPTGQDAIDAITADDEDPSSAGAATSPFSATCTTCPRGRRSALSHRRWPSAARRSTTSRWTTR